LDLRHQEKMRTALREQLVVQSRTA
jgi:hypothetical protein